MGLIVKAKLQAVSSPAGFEILIYAGKIWRIFGTPYKKALDERKPFECKKNAKRAGDLLASELNITLEWEV